MLRATGKTAEQCETRWFEYLTPQISHAEWTRDEEARLLDLVRTWGSNWRTIAQQLRGRTPAQCQERHGQLLDAARSAATSATGGAGGGSAVVFHQVDHRPETRAARLDTIDEDRDEKMLLDEARARLANTLGRKGLRKQRERALVAAKQRAAVQHHRELRAAAAAGRVGGDAGGGDDADFVPVSTAEVDGRVPKPGAADGADAAAKATQQTSAAAPRKGESATVATATAASRLVNAATVPTGSATLASFSFGSAGALTTGPASTAGAAASGTLRITAGATAQQAQLVVPRALQEKRAAAAAASAAAKAARAQAAAASSAAPSALSAAVASAIRDGGRTRRQTETLLRSGASASLPQWLREQRGWQLPAPDPDALADCAARAPAASAERLVLRMASELAAADRAVASRAASGIAVGGDGAARHAPLPPPLQRRATLAGDSDGAAPLEAPAESARVLIDVGRWAEDCASAELAAAVRIVDEAAASDPAAAAAAAAARVTAHGTAWEPTAASASVALGLLQRTAACDAWRSSQRRLAAVVAGNALGAFRRAASDAASASASARFDVGAAAVQDAARGWEVASLSAAYDRAAAAVRDAKVQSDAALAAAVEFA
jgi:hypothetical protein